MFVISSDLLANGFGYKTIAITGNAAPGVGPGVNFGAFLGPVINDAGQVAFRGILTGPGVVASNGTGIWSGMPDDLTLVARLGNAAPGTFAGARFTEIEQPILNDQGRVAFQSDVVDNNGQLFGGIWSNVSGPLALVALTGNAPPAMGPNVRFKGIDVPAMNDGNRIVFGARAGSNFSEGAGIWVNSGGILKTVAYEDSPSPGFPTTVRFVLSSSAPIINGPGDVYFAARVEDSVPFGVSFHAIWKYSTSGGLEVIRRDDDPVPGMPGIVFGGPTLVAANDAGEVAYRVSFSGVGIDANNDGSIWVERAAGFEMIARDNDPAPGIAGASFGLLGGPAINARGEIAFRASVHGQGISDNRTGIWTDASGQLELVARESQPAPGTPDGVYFRRIQGEPVLNARGQIAFHATLDGPDVSGNTPFSNNQGVWATDSQGVLRLVARTGDMFDVNDDPTTEDLRKIESVAFGTTLIGGQEGRYTKFNGIGQLVLAMRFTDTTEGVFIVNTTIVPEPTSSALLVMTGLTLFVGRRHSRRANTTRRSQSTPGSTDR